ncbi:MAG TPA: P1 family peptidase [Candidatus Paceibacterota bacterium]
MKKVGNSKKGIREYGCTPGLLPAGKSNSISDVSGVTVGHVTKIQGGTIRTGLTLVDPGVPNLFRNKVPAAIAVGNGFGKLTGLSQVEELGTIETPIVLTNTLAVGKVMRGVVDLVIKNTPDLKDFETINAVVGETNDGILNDIQADILDGKDVADAYNNRTKKVGMGNVGAGTGTRAFSWKGGIGTSSRVITIHKKKYVVGALVQTNFGGSLTIMGVPVGEILGKNDYQFLKKTLDGSCMIVLATDAPLDARQLKRVAKRGLLGMVRTGSIMAHGSGDYSIAFSTDVGAIERVKESDLTPFFLAAVEAVEESIYNALFTAETLSGKGGAVLEALPSDEIVALLRKYEK